LLLRDNAGRFERHWLAVPRHRSLAPWNARGWVVRSPEARLRGPCGGPTFSNFTEILDVNRRVARCSTIAPVRRAGRRRSRSRPSPKECDMTKMTALLAGLLVLGAPPAVAQDHPMTFFLTSAGPSNGAALGGLEGADAHCRQLAETVGAGALEWHAYLSALASGTAPAVHARDRIGTGPWYNAKGVMVAESVADLHSDDNNLTKETVLSERGEPVNGRGDQPNMHDILTGSNLDGTAFMADGYTNCDNWTGSGEGSARVGHHDRTGGGENPTSWNSAHNSRGCSQENLQGTGGNGLFYCFAVGGM
jgi:hypothetical protein